MVYVDDFKLSGPKENLKKGWELIKKGLSLDEPGDIGRCLGCHHKIRSAKVDGKEVQVVEYVVSDFMSSCVDAYKKACGEPNMKLRPVDTPFLPSPEGGGGGDVTDAAASAGSATAADEDCKEPKKRGRPRFPMKKLKANGLKTRKYRARLAARRELDRGGCPVCREPKPYWYSGRGMLMLGLREIDR